MKPRLRARAEIISLPRDEVVGWKNVRRCCAKSRNSALDGLKSILFEFIPKSMLVKVLKNISSAEIKFEGVKDLHS